MMEQKNDTEDLKEIDRLMRYWILTMTTTAGSGHPTSSLSAVELMSTLLFSGIFRFDITDKNSKHNDRLIFSKGHASPLLYALWTAAGQIDPKDLDTYRKFDSILEGHPTTRFPFTEAATGSLGQGLSVGLGMALAAKYLDKTDARTYVLLGDSEMSEGSVWEALEVSAHYDCDNLIGIIDVNRLGQRGETMLGHDVEKYRARCESFGWNAIVVDGHDNTDILHAYRSMIGVNGKPTMIIAKTIKGQGVSFIADEEGWHGKTLDRGECDRAIEELGDIDLNARGTIALPAMRDDNAVDAAEVVRTENNESIAVQPTEYKIGEDVAVRDAYGTGLTTMMAENKKIVVLDAEVSNSTRAETAKEAFPDRFFEMFIAEQNMVGVAIGLARRGYIPYVSSFAAFLTRAHGQIRMAQFSDVQIVFVGSHAGVSIGEDGGSQMGIEDIAIFRALMDSVVVYPSDAVSMEKLTSAVLAHDGLSYIRSTRSGVPVLYDQNEEFTIGGSKVLRESANDVYTIIAAGITVHEALKAHEILAQKKIAVRVIDLYSIKPIDKITVHKALYETGGIVTVEDHYSEGGIGEAVRSICHGHCTKVTTLAVRKTPHSGTPEELLAYEEIDAQAIVVTIQQLITIK